MFINCFFHCQSYVLFIFIFLCLDVLFVLHMNMYINNVLFVGFLNQTICISTCIYVHVTLASWPLGWEFACLESGTILEINTHSNFGVQEVEFSASASLCTVVHSIYWLYRAGVIREHVVIFFVIAWCTNSFDSIMLLPSQDKFVVWD